MVFKFQFIEPIISGKYEFFNYKKITQATAPDAGAEKGKKETAFVYLTKAVSFLVPMFITKLKIKVQVSLRTLGLGLHSVKKMPCYKRE